MSVVTVYAVFANAEEGERLAAQVVEEGLAACANLLGPCRSIYRWKGVVERSEETPALFKTSDSTADRLIARLAELHSYDVPAIVQWPVDRLLADYATWVESAVR